MIDTKTCLLNPFDAFSTAVCCIRLHVSAAKTPNYGNIKNKNGGISINDCCQLAFKNFKSYLEAEMFAEESFKPAPPWICLLEGILVAWNDQETPSFSFLYGHITGI
jgi:hypothetical protein